jgi:hypothetical protein
MQIAWKGLIPILLVLVVATTVLVYLFDGRTYNGLSGADALGFLVLNVACLLLIAAGSFLVPAGEHQNVRVRVPESRFGSTPLPAGVGRRFMPSEQIAEPSTP